MRFRDALAGPGLSAIAEIKRRSPSAGDLRPDADPTGSPASSRPAARLRSRSSSTSASAARTADLAAARAGTTLPILAKGFFGDPAELAELQQLGADAVLLLLRDLDDRTAAELMAAARDLGLDALVEAHTAAELERAVRLGADPIGINARDLATFQIDRAAQLDLVAKRLCNRLLLSRRGSSSRRAGSSRGPGGRGRARRGGRVLVGSALMRAADPGAKLRELLARPLVKVCG